MSLDPTFLPVELPTNLLLISHPSEWGHIKTELEGLVHPADFWTSAAAVPVMAELAQFQNYLTQSPVGQAKIAFFTSVDQYRPEVVNALLKVVEEPPVYLYCVFLSESENITPTLRSRLQKFSHQRLVNRADSTNRELWAETIQNLLEGSEKQQAAAQTLLFWYPLMHQGIKSEPILSAFKRTV